jgi:DNA/RNA endonuclease YhcR with UshA esterase domain
LYTDYPIGRKVYIKCKGLYIGEYNGFVQLGYLPDNSNSLSDIPTNLITKYVVKANYPNVVAPRVVSIPEILTVNATNKKWIGTLLQLDSVEIALNEVGTPYADDASISSGSNRTIMDCAKEKLILRNSGYSSFRNYFLPSGKGPLTAVFSVFGKDAQFLIRDTNDLKLYGPRCTSNASLVSIRSIRNLFTGSTVTVPPNTKIRGIVISDKNAKNINDRNIVIQDATAGVVVRFNSNSGLPSQGDEVEVTISGGTVSLFSGILQVGGISNSEYMKFGQGAITPKIATLKQINDSLDNWESTLVKVMGATFSSGSGSYSGSNTLNDGTSTITHYVASSATFASSPYPTTAKNYTGIVGRFNTTKQISIRNLNDVE